MNEALKNEIKEAKDISLIYVSVPFCKYRCHFCCFTSNIGPDLLLINKYKVPYLLALKKELAVKSLYFTTKHNVNLKAINFGGGTPSLLTVAELGEVLFSILKFFNQKIDRIRDISIEVTPDSLTYAKLKELRSIGFNRISIGAQTFNQQILNKLNRKHSVRDFYAAYDWARSAGFQNINIDLLYLIPSQTFADLKKDLNTVIRINPEHISPSPVMAVKSLLFGIKTEKYNKATMKKIRWASYVHEFLQQKGYGNYFHKYFSKTGKESVSELVCFYNVPFIGIGAGAESWLGSNTVDLKSYISKSFSRGLFAKDTPYNPLRAMLRMLLFPEGIHIPYFNKKYDCDIEKLVKNPEIGLYFYEKLKNVPEEIIKEDREWQRKAVKAIKIKWAKGIIEKQSDYIKITPAARFSKETWRLYMSSI
jgi:oxygen-independent coproporphyrinogen III oxidase